MSENTIKTIKISRIINECKNVKTIIFHNSTELRPNPGQFVMVWVPGVDEIPMSISACDEVNDWAITVKNVGDCTQALHDLKINDLIGVRGPLGNSFDKPVNKNKNIFLIGGGIGMAPLRFLAYELNKSNQDFKIIQGAKVESDLLFMDELYEYDRRNSEFHFCTDDGNYGEKGVTTDIFQKLIKEYTLEQLKNTIVYSCGPEIMLFKLFQICVKHDIEFYASLERIMRCGCGICGLCALDPLGLLVCKDGPIFNSKQLEKIEDFGKFKRDFTGKKMSI
ncbi:MAG: dihydroorotate dehydrogenase electron transfer subunit [Candidatus Lokiarchaeota archaeon]|nr:dihydroorotate dehydrogenase electron transfer subunit [Candidatus Lokiarchaeota archaeon]